MNDEAQALTTPTEKPKALTWPRFFARHFDLMIAYLLLSCILYISPDNFFPAINELKKNIWIRFLLFCPLNTGAAIVIDAIIYRLFGNTPGKALLNLKVHKPDDVKPSFSFYLKRNVYMWVYGFAFDLPIFFVTWMYQAKRLEDGKKTTYDEKLNCSVAAQPISMSRKLLFICLFILLEVGSEVLPLPLPLPWLI